MPETGSWEGLTAIVDEYRQAIAEDRAMPPSACPEDGVPLETGPRGELHCRFCGEVWS